MPVMPDPPAHLKSPATAANRSLCTFSLVMATYGRAEMLKPMLDSLAAQTDRDFELIVVDQNKDERIVGLLEAARSQGIAITHLKLDQPNLSAARNLGLAHARAEIIAIPDDDCWYEPDVLQQVRAHFAANTALDGVVARWVELGPAVSDLPRPLSSDDWRNFRGGDATSFTLFLKREAVVAHNGFDPRIGTGRWFGAGEEIDLVMTILAAGRRLDALPAARIHHAFAAAPPLTRASCRRARMYARGVGAIYAKHRLSAWVVGRGLAAPILKAIAGPRPLAGLVLGICATWGRIEGLIGWLWWHGRREHPGKTH